MSTFDDPWMALAPPRETHSLTARRVDESGRWNFFWARDHKGDSLLVLRFEHGPSPIPKLPRLRGVDVSFADLDNVGPALVLRLLDATLREIFFRLCRDIMESAARAASEPEAVATAIGRTWRWHHLMRGGAGGLLSREEQKGLLGELFVFERYFLDPFPPSVAVGAWRGPLGEAQDFVLGRTGVESKACGRESSGCVWINSEFQLDDTSLDTLFVHLSVFDLAEPSGDDGFSLADVVHRIGERLRPDADASARYDALLAAAGFSDDDDYGSVRWTGGERSIYKADYRFPRIIAPAVPAGISNVRYSVSLAGCGEFLVAPSALEHSLLEVRSQ